MKSDKQSAEPVARVSGQSGTLRCDHRKGRVFNKTYRTVIDDSGSLAITAWTCAMCDDLVEEIRLLSRNGISQLHPIRYTVASRAMTEQLATPALS